MTRRRDRVRWALFCGGCVAAMTGMLTPGHPTELRALLASALGTGTALVCWAAHRTQG